MFCRVWSHTGVKLVATEHEPQGCLYAFATSFTIVCHSSSMGTVHKIQGLKK